MPEQELKEIRTRSNRHIDHIAFDLDDIDKTFSLSKNASFNILEEQPILLAFWKNGCKYFNITGPDGERAQLMGKFFLMSYFLPSIPFRLNYRILR